MKKITLILISLLMFSLIGVKGQEVVFGSLNWEPYIGEKLKNMGYVAEIAKTVFANEGYQLKIKYYPWARSVKMAKSGKLTGYFPEYYAKSLEKDFILSDPFPGGPIGFFKRIGSTISYKKLEDLKSYKIGVVRGYVNEENFDKVKFLKKEGVTDDITNIKKLLKERIDLFVADKFVGFYLLKKNFPHMVGQIVFMEPALENKDLYLCISKKVKDHDKIIKAFNRGLKKLKESGGMEKIMTKHGF